MKVNSAGFASLFTIHYDKLICAFSSAGSSNCLLSSRSRVRIPQGTPQPGIPGNVVGLAQLVRAPGCGPGGRGFDSHISPQIKTKHSAIAECFVFISSCVTESNPSRASRVLRVRQAELRFLRTIAHVRVRRPYHHKITIQKFIIDKFFKILYNILTDGCGVRFRCALACSHGNFV